jgi:CHAT domain-containing protein
VGNYSLIVSYNGETLLGAEDEAREVAKLLKTEALIGEADATNAGVLERIHSARWIHFATHTVIDEANPDLSYLSLSGDQQIEAWQLFRDAPQAEMIVLSACDTKLEAFGLSRTGSDLDTRSLTSFAFSGGLGGLLRAFGRRMTI